MLPAPAVFSSSSRQLSDSASACFTISPTRGSASSSGSPTVEPGWTHDAVGADLVAHAQRVDQRGGGLLAHLPVLGGRVDQVDGVDRDRLDRPVLHQLEELGDVVVLPARRPPLARRLVEDLDRVAAALDAALVRLHQAACRGNVGADEHESQVRTQPDGRAAHRRRADGTVQLASRARIGRHLRAAHRGHRPRALDARERRADPRRAALARARLGRGADLAGRAARPSTAPRSSGCSTTGTPTRTRARCGCACPTRARRSSRT